MARKIGRMGRDFKTSVKGIALFKGFTSLDWMQIRSYQRVSAIAKEPTISGNIPSAGANPGSLAN
jgi:hypothetical protein